MRRLLAAVLCVSAFGSGGGNRSEDTPPPKSVAPNQEFAVRVGLEANVAEEGKDRDALCRKANERRDIYLEIWRKQFLKRNKMDRTYFDSHVSVTKYDVGCQWNDGLAMEVNYRVTYGWAAIDHKDEFVLLLYDQDAAYRHLPIKRNHLFNEEEVSYAIDQRVYFSSISPVKALDKLKFSSYEDALKVFRKKAGSEKLDNVRLSFSVPGNVPRENGYPFLLGRGLKDVKRNECVVGHMNLVTGETVMDEYPCRVN